MRLLVGIRFQILALTLAAVGLLGGCQRQLDSDRLIVISPHPETTLYEFEWAFRPWYRERAGRDIHIEWRDLGGTSRMLRFLYSEFERLPDGIEIDMVWGGGLDAFLDLASRNLLQPYVLARHILRAIPRDYGGMPLYDPQYRWYGTALTGFGIVYNRRVLELQRLPTPQTWTDLADPAFYSWVGIADPRQSGTAHMAAEIILQAHGWEKGWETLTFLGANVSAFTRLASDVPRDVALGQIAAGFCIDNYAYSQMAISGRDVIGFVMPEGLTVSNPDGIGILKGAPNINAARLLMEFVVSEPGQRLIMTPAGKPGGPRQFNISRMAIAPQIYDSLGTQTLVPINPFRLKPAMKYNSVKGSERWELINDIIGVFLIENHDLLKRAWRAANACEAQHRDRLLRRLSEMPVNENEAIALAREKWRDAVTRNRVLVDWSQFARTKYAAVLHQAQQSLLKTDNGQLTTDN